MYRGQHALTMDFNEIRKNVILAIFSDDQFLEKLVLKGGNAISLVHRLDYRTSLDLDFSMAGDFENLVETSQRLFVVSISASLSTSIPKSSSNLNPIPYRSTASR
jgi:predicted nucleotidyltransferase component of viral defense system